MDWYSLKIDVSNDCIYVLTWRIVGDTRLQVESIDSFDEVVEFLKANFKGS